MTRRPFLAALSAFGLAPGLAVAQAGAARIEPLVLSDAQWYSVRGMIILTSVLVSTAPGIDA